jgi:hypothetical protein
MPTLIFSATTILQVTKQFFHIVTRTSIARQRLVNKLPRKQTLDKQLLGYSTIEEAVVSVSSVPRSSGNSGIMQPFASHRLCKHGSTSTIGRLCFLCGPCRGYIRRVVRWQNQLEPGVQKNTGGRPVMI